MDFTPPPIPVTSPLERYVYSTGIAAGIVKVSVRQIQLWVRRGLLTPIRTKPEKNLADTTGGRRSGDFRFDHDNLIIAAITQELLRSKVPMHQVFFVASTLQGYRLQVKGPYMPLISVLKHRCPIVMLSKETFLIFPRITDEKENNGSGDVIDPFKAMKMDQSGYKEEEAWKIIKSRVDHDSCVILFNLLSIADRIQPPF